MSILGANMKEDWQGGYQRPCADFLLIPLFSPWNPFPQPCPPLGRLCAVLSRVSTLTALQAQGGAAACLHSVGLGYLVLTCLKEFSDSSSFQPHVTSLSRAVLCHKSRVFWRFCNASEVKVARLCPTLCNPMDYTVHSPWNSPGWNTGVGSLSLLWGFFPTQGLNPGLLHCRQILYQLSHKNSAFSSVGLGFS